MRRNYPEDYPATTSGDMLDGYLNTVDMKLGHIRQELEGVDRDKIPSSVQRRAFDLLVTLLNEAESFTGTLRYDVSADHTECPEHDDHAERKIQRCFERLDEQRRLLA